MSEETLTDREAGYLMVVAKEYYFQKRRYSEAYIRDCLRRKGFAKFFPKIGWRMTKKGETALRKWVVMK